MLNNVLAYIYKLTEYGELKLECTFESTKFKVPKIKVKIVDKSLPKNVRLTIMSDYGFCYSKGNSFDIEFNSVNFTSTVEYDIKSSYINITTYKNMGKYEYTITSVEKKGEMKEEEINVDIYVKNITCVNTKLINRTKIPIEVPAINSNESQIIDSISFCKFCKRCPEGFFFFFFNCTKKCEIGEN